MSSLKAGSINGKKPYLNSINELIATSAFSSSPLFGRKCGHFFIVLLYGFSLSAVFSVGSDYALSDFLKDDYLHQVIAFSVGQAFLSALLSSVIGALFARAFFYLDFKGKLLILRIFSLTFVLPALLAIFGLIGIYGTAGWLTQLLQTLGISWKTLHFMV